jgi:hypothetical protein
MGIFLNGNQFDDQTVEGVPIVVSGVTTGYNDNSANATAGLNIAAPSASGNVITILVPNATSYATRTFDVLAYGNANGIVKVSGVGCTINDSTAALTISNGTSKTFFNNVVGYNVEVSGVAVPSVSGNWIAY